MNLRLVFSAGLEEGTLGEAVKEKKGSWLSKMLGNDLDSVNVRAAYIHVLGDLVQNVGVMLAAVLIWINPNWRFMDPLCTIFFIILVVSCIRPHSHGTGTAHT